MFGIRNRRRTAELEARVERLVEQLAEARENASAHLGASKRTSGYNARLTDELAAQTRRADQLQQRLDDAVGINTPAVDSGLMWQQRRGDKPKPGPIGASQ